MVSTGTKNLQEQLFFKDIPFLQQHFSRPLEVCYMKGRDNYACRQKIYDAEKEPVLDRPGRGRRFPDHPRVGEDHRDSATAPRSRRCPKPAPPGPRSTRAASSAPARSARNSSAASSPLMHQRAPESDIIIVNHHLFFADLALQRRRSDEGGILPEYHAVVFDEAHEIEDVAGQYFGVSVSNYQFQELRRDIAVIGRMKKFGIAGTGPHPAARWTSCAAQFFALFGEADRRVGLRGPRRVPAKTTRKSIRDLLAALELIGSHLKLLQNPPEEIMPLFRRAQRTEHRACSFCDGRGRRALRLLDREARPRHVPAGDADRVSRHRSPRSCSTQVDTVVLTSATLAVAGGFELRAEAAGPAQRAHPGRARPFRLPEAGAALRAAAPAGSAQSGVHARRRREEVIEILQHSRGRAFVLFTSYQQMRLVYDRVSLEIEYPTLMQGTGPRSALLDEFRATPQLRAVRDLVVLAGRGRAGRAVELRYHR